MDLQWLNTFIISVLAVKKPFFQLSEIILHPQQSAQITRHEKKTFNLFISHGTKKGLKSLYIQCLKITMLNMFNYTDVFLRRKSKQIKSFEFHFLIFPKNNELNLFHLKMKKVITK